MARGNVGGRRPPFGSASRKAQSRAAYRAANGGTPTPTPTPALRLSGASGGQSLGEYPYLRGTPNVAVQFATSLRALFGLPSVRTFNRYNTNTIVHDGSSQNAADWSVRLDNYSSGGSAVLSSNSTTTDRNNGNFWWNDIDSSAATGNAADVINSPGPLLRAAIAGIAARTAAGFPIDFFDWSQGTAEGGLNANDPLTAIYKAVLRDQIFGRIRAASGNPTLPIFIYRNGRHQTAGDDAQERVRKVQSELVAEMTNCHIAAEEYPYRFAITGSSTGDVTIGSNVIANVASVAAFGVNQGIEAAAFPAGAYVSAIGANSLTISILVNGVVTPCNATATASGQTISNLDNVHLYPGSTAQPMDTAGNTQHNATDGFYAVRAVAARRIAQVFGKGGITAARGPYVSGVACQKGQNTLTVSIAHVAGTDFTMGDKTGWRVTLDGTAVPIVSVAKVNATTVTITLADDIYAATVGVQYGWGTMNRADRTQFIFDNATPIAYPMQARVEMTAATTAQSVFETETNTLVAAMTAAPTTNRKIAIDRRIARLKNAGVWSLIDQSFALAAADEQAARLDWKNPALSATKVGLPAFAVDRGYTGLNTTTDYLDLLYNPSANGGADSRGMGVNDAHFSVFALTTGTSTTAALIDSSSRGGIRARSGSAAYVKVNSGTTTAMTDSAATPCQVTGCRSDSANQRGYRNGTPVLTAAVASTSLSSALTLLKSTDQQVAMTRCGKNMTDAQVAAAYTADYQYLRAVGAL